MKTVLKRSLLFLFLGLVIGANAQDTFSIVAVDSETGEVGSAGASCIDDADCNGCGGVIIISGLIPGVGAMNSQAWACIPNINLENGLNIMEQGYSPDSVLNYVLANDGCWAANFDHSFRQYGVVDLDNNGQPRATAYTGENADDYKNHIIGDDYAIQGNILLGQEILDNMEAGFVNTQGSLAVRLMAALQGANIAGADARCLDEGVSSKSAFIRVARPEDSVDDLYLELNVPQTPFGDEPIDALQTLFDEWLLTSNTESISDVELEIAPNPAQTKVTFQLSKLDRLQGGQVSFYDVNGILLYQIPITKNIIHLHKTDIQNTNLVFYTIKNQEGQSLKTGKLIFQD